MGYLDFEIRGQRAADETRRERSPREQAVRAVILLLVAAFAADYSRRRLVPIAELSPLEPFGPQPAGTRSEPRIVTVRNTGRAPLHLVAVGITGDAENAFYLPQDECSGAVLAPDTSCEVTVAFVPQTAGAHQAVLTIQDDARNSPQALVLGGTGVGEIEPPMVAHAEAGLDPPEARFFADVGSTQSQPIAVTNAGDAPLRLSGIDFSGERGDFSFASSACTFEPIKPGGRCPFGVSFAPRQAGPQETTLAIAHDAHGSPLLLSLQGQGNGPPEGYCCIEHQIVKANALECAARQGEFSSDAEELERRCAPFDREPPPPPEETRPGRGEGEPPNLFPCREVVLEWSPVADRSEPVRYEVAFEIGLGDPTVGRPARWVDALPPQAHELLASPRADATPWIAAQLDRRRNLETEYVGRREELRREKPARRRLPMDATSVIPNLVPLAEFRWQVRAVDAAQNVGSYTEPKYFSCVRREP